MRPAGWMLNGQMPTGHRVTVEWKGGTFEASEYKYTFLRGLDFADQITVIDSSESGAWAQLCEKLKIKY